ncbi:MAG TPA: T9SS type A sorting domain-containing protein [Puia sp.]|jgi:hypothetical protein|nr:T9SS type A sorting domain-containing protein [Puia sp.]
MKPRLPLCLAGSFFLLLFPFLSYCCDTWTSIQAVPLTGDCSTKISFVYVECNSSGIYYIQYSPDDVNYYIIGSVTPNGSGSYSYTDNYAHPQSSRSAKVYYRAIYYIAGIETVYSPIASVTLDSTSCSNNNVTRCNGLSNFSISGPNGICYGASPSSYTISGTILYPVTWSVTTDTAYVTLTQNLSGATVAMRTGYEVNYSTFTLVANEEGCDAKSDLIYLGIPPGPTSMTPADGSSVKAGDQYDIYSAPANWWYVTNGTVVYGQGTNDLGVQVANLSSGYLTIKAMVVDPCDTSPMLIYQYPISKSGGGGGGGTLFLSDSAAGSNTGFGSGIKLGVYPNPVTNTVQVSIAATDYSKSYIKLFDLNGHLLKMIVPSGQTTLVDMTQQSKGIYMMEIFDGKQRTVQKIVRL